MKVIPLPVGRRTAGDSEGCLPPGAARATGSFLAPSGGRGTFTGTYRITRAISLSGELATTGVMSGVLRNPDGTFVGVGGRRCTAAVRVMQDADALELVVGPLEIDLLGFLVTVDALPVEIPQENRGPGLAGTLHLARAESRR